MKCQHPTESLYVMEVISYPLEKQVAPPAIPVHRMAVAPERTAFRALVPLLSLALAGGGGYWIKGMYDSQLALRDSIQALAHESAVASTRSAAIAARLQDTAARNEATIAVLDAESQHWRETALRIEAGMAAALSRKDARADDKPDAPAAPTPELMTEAMPVEAGETPETAATANPVLREIEIVHSLAAAPVEGPPTLDEIHAHIEAKDPRVTTNLDDAKPNHSFLTTLAHPIVVDSAVLAGSLFVPASLPLTLAQSDAAGIQGNQDQQDGRGARRRRRRQHARDQEAEKKVGSLKNVVSAHTGCRTCSQ